MTNNKAQQLINDLRAEGMPDAQITDYLAKGYSAENQDVVEEAYDIITNNDRGSLKDIQDAAYEASKPASRKEVVEMVHELLLKLETIEERIAILESNIKTW